MTGEQVAFRRSAVGAPVSEYSRLIDRARVNKGGHGTDSSMVFDAATSLPGVLVTAHATPHTKGTAVELVASTGFAAEEVEVIVSGVSATGTNTSMMVDIVTGAGLTTVTIPKVLVGYLLAGGQTVPYVFRFPVAIPAGTRVGAQIQGAVTVDDIRVAVRLHQAGLHSAAGNSVVAYGADEATSSGAVLTTATSTHTKSAWTLIGTTSQDHTYFTVGLSNNSTAGVDASGSVDIALDDDDTDIVIHNLCYGTGSTEFLRYETANLHTVNAPSGSPIYGRYQSTSTAVGGKVNVAVYGSG